MNILVTGSAGFIGAYVRDALHASGHTMIPFDGDRDVCDTRTVAKAIEEDGRKRSSTSPVSSARGDVRGSGTARRRRQHCRRGHHLRRRGQGGYPGRADRHRAQGPAEPVRHHQGCRGRPRARAGPVEGGTDRRGPRLPRLRRRAEAVPAAWPVPGTEDHPLVHLPGADGDAAGGQRGRHPAHRPRARRRRRGRARRRDRRRRTGRSPKPAQGRRPLFMRRPTK